MEKFALLKASNIERSMIGFEPSQGNREADARGDGAVQKKGDIGCGSVPAEEGTLRAASESPPEEGHRSLIFALLVIGLSTLFVLKASPFPATCQALFACVMFAALFHMEARYVKWRTGARPVRTGLIYGVFAVVGIISTVGLVLKN